MSDIPIDPLLPDYGGACIASVVPALLGRDDPSASRPSWLPEVAFGARQVVLLVLDGLGWNRLSDSISDLRSFSEGIGGPITSVAPSTTATALTSIATGVPPNCHGIVGYRLRLAPPDVDGGEEVMNILKWRAPSGDLRQRVLAQSFQQVDSFAGRNVPVVTRAEFGSTGFSAAHLRGARLIGWQVPSTLVLEIRELLKSGETFIHAYYDGLDKVAHSKGTGDHYFEELKAVDRIIGDIASVLPPGAALVITSDHGQVDVLEPARTPSADLMKTVRLMSGEGRFRWLHSRPGAESEMFAVAAESHGDEAWVLTTKQMEADGWFGGPLSVQAARRLGDVAIVARERVAFLDPADTGESALIGRHGSLTPDEMFVPLLSWGSR